MRQSCLLIAAVIAMSALVSCARSDSSGQPGNTSSDGSLSDLSPMDASQTPTDAGGSATAKGDGSATGGEDVSGARTDIEDGGTHSSPDADDAVDPECAEATASVDCDDGNMCTDEACEDGVCIYATNTTACDDDNACTIDDVCSDGVCSGGEPLECANSNPCTESACQPDQGCVITDLDGIPCDDANHCTLDDICLSGECVEAGNSLDCDDRKPCTADSCEPDSGCVNEPFISNACRPVIIVDYPPRGANLVQADASITTVEVTGTVKSDAGPIISLTINGEAVEVGADHTFAGAVNATIGGNTIELVATDAADSVKNRVQAFHWSPSYLLPEDLSVFFPESFCDGTIEADTCFNAVLGGDITWAAAEEECLTWGGHLVSIHSEEENAYVRALATTACEENPLWIGLNDLAEEGAFVWTDNSAADYLNWAGEDPTGLDGEDAVEMGLDGQWEAVSTETLRACFACSKPYIAPSIEYSGHADPGMGLFLSPELLDDGDHSLPPDDLATVFESIFAGFDVNALIPSPAAAGVSADDAIFDVYINDLIHDAPTVALTPIVGGWAIDALIANATADIHAQKLSGGSIFTPNNINGTLTIETISIDAEVAIGVDDNRQIEVTVTSNEITIEGVDIDISGIFGGIIEGQIAGVIDDLIADIETQFADSLGSLLETTMIDALGALALGFDFELPSVNPEDDPIILHVKTDFSWVDFAEDGDILSLRAIALPAEKVLTHNSLGAPARSGCGLKEQQLVVLKESPLEIVMTDDTVNLILFSAWEGGFVEFDVPAELLGDLDLDALGVTNLVATVSGMLAPAISDCGPDGELNLHLGDVKMTASMEFVGSPLDVLIYVSFSAPFSITADEGEVSFGITDISELSTELTVQQDAMIGAEPILLSLIEEKVMPVLLATLSSDTLGAIPLPAIDLSETLGDSPNAKIGIKPNGVQRQDGNNIIAAELAPGAEEVEP